ncbi:MAG: cytochrome c oxidase assembly protein, partial [Gammaproteobacteria bacterium]|nr:cytochrome c oxidase assembly protein [Gammaproteobacteria bacterium]NIV21974.1 cytochrome c oxidase assembly protein [Gammaproteobacteria bacterium]
RSRGFPFWRPLCLGLGVGLLGLALLGPVDLLADYAFTWHMVQHELLVLVGVPLLLLGAPFIPVLRGLPRGFRRRVFAPFARNRAVRGTLVRLTHPLAG